MKENNVIDLAGRESGRDELTELLRNGARTLIAQALEAELAELLEKLKDHRDEQGRALVVRNGYQPEREIQTGIGPVTVKVPKVRGPVAASRSFSAQLWYRPMYARRAAWRRHCRGCT